MLFTLVLHLRRFLFVLLTVLQGELGEVVPGAAADLILVDGDPLADIACLAGSGSSSSAAGSSDNINSGTISIPLVIKDGLLAKVRLVCGQLLGPPSAADAAKVVLAIDHTTAASDFKCVLTLGDFQPLKQV